MSEFQIFRDWSEKMIFEIRRDWSPLDDLCRLELAAAERYRDVGYNPDPWPPTTPEDFAAYRDLGLLWVAVSDIRAVGFAVVDVYGDHAHLEEIDVLPEMQGRGVGAMLIREVIDDATRRTSTAVTLRTFLTTPWSVGLYEKMGFRRWDPDPPPEYLRTIMDDEQKSGLSNDDRLSMKLKLPR